MVPDVKWTLPVASTALLGGGAVFEIRPKRDIAIHFAYEATDDSLRKQALIFHGVEAFKCTYYRARDASMLEGYDKLVDRGPSAWLEELCRSLKKNGSDAQGRIHLMINFDDGPAYEVVCRSFHVEDE